MLLETRCRLAGAVAASGNRLPAVVAAGGYPATGRMDMSMRMMVAVGMFRVVPLRMMDVMVVFVVSMMLMMRGKRRIRKSKRQQH
jgi:hypothetical protein